MSIPEQPFPEIPAEQAAPPAPPPAPPPRDPVWTGWDLLVSLVLGVFALFGSAIVMFVLLGGLPQSAVPGGQLLVVSLTAQIFCYLAILGFLYGVVRLRDPRPFLELVRWNWERAQQSWFALLAFGALVALTVTWASSFLPMPKSPPIEEMLKDTASAYILALFGTFIGPLAEELFYRGFLYPTLERRLGMVPGVAITSLPFALMHGPQYGWGWASLMLLFLVSLVLTVTRVRTGSVAAAYVMHLGYNATLFLGLFVHTGGFRQMERLGR